VEEIEFATTDKGFGGTMEKVAKIFVILLLFVSVNLSANAAEKNDDDPDADEKMDLLYLPTPEYIVDKMLELAQVKKGDVVYDLGCGDGRIVVRAAKKYGVRGVGIDLNPERVIESLENVKEHKVEKLVKIKQGNILKEDVRKASVVMLYILPDLMAKLEPVLLKQLKPGSRVVSHAFQMDEWKAEKEITYEYEGANYNLYLYIVPQKTDKKQSKK